MSNGGKYDRCHLGHFQQIGIDKAVLETIQKTVKEKTCLGLHKRLAGSHSDDAIAGLAAKILE